MVDRGAFKLQTKEKKDAIQASLSNYFENSKMRKLNVNKPVVNITSGE